MSEKRRHARVVHRDVVRFDAAGTTFEGVSVDISQTGIQVEVAVPESFDRVEKVRFSLPDSPTELNFPVRVARAAYPSGETGSRMLALEFLHGADQQIRLIENFVRESKAGGSVSDDRRIPRLDCAIPATIDADLHEVTIDNISPDGVLVRARGTTTVDAQFVVRFTLPGDDRPVETTCRVAYIVRAHTGVRFGARFVELPHVLHARVAGFIERTAASRSLQSLLDRPDERGLWIDGEALTQALAEARSTALFVLFENDPVIRSARMSGPDGTAGGDSIAIELDAPVPAEPGTAVFATFSANSSSHYFSSIVTTTFPADDGASTRVCVERPRRAHRTDSRSYGRKRVSGSNKIQLSAMDETGRTVEVGGSLIDISWRGFLCEITTNDDSLPMLSSGCPVTYQVDPQFALMNHGRVRHVTEREPADEKRVFHIGVEAGIQRGDVVHTTISAEEWRERVNAVPCDDDHDQSFQCVSRRISYHNRRGREIVALLNRVNGPGDPTVVVIPPAFGKKKETLAPLAVTLCTNFARADRPVVVIRYDGINRAGESYNQVEKSVRGYEMLHYRPSQGVDDIRTTLDYVHGNDEFVAGKVVLVTSSMSSVDARKLLLTDSHRVDGWISLMGVTAARTTLARVLGGTDIVTNYKMNIRNGVRGMLGHLVDMDVLARDLLDRKYAYLTDARLDMSRIALPVWWIVGEHDQWVDGAEVDDIMSVESTARREVIRIPSGHNVRTSDDAAETFRMIAEQCASVAGVPMTAMAPRRELVIDVVAREREAVYTPLDTTEVSAYWHAYLLGERSGSEGYDFYANLPAFRAFIEEQVDLMDLHPGCRIADMGCGTGLVTEAIVRRIAERSHEVPAGVQSVVEAIDLVPEALRRTKAKCRAVLEATPSARDVVVSYGVEDLEPNRFLPVADFVDHPSLPVTFLTGRIEGLPDRVVRLWQRADDRTLHAYLRGEHNAQPVRVPEAAFATEFNRAARFVRGKLTAGDLRNAPPGRPDGTPVPPATVRADDLLFSLLSFGTCGAPRPQVGQERRYDVLVASLFVSYIINPDYLLTTFHRSIRPGGRIVISSMRPDSDVSTIFTDYVRRAGENAAEAGRLEAATAMLNEAAALFELEEDGHFRFYSARDLTALLTNAGFADVRVVPSLGTPHQAYIAVGTAAIDVPEPWGHRV